MRADNIYLETRPNRNDIDEVMIWLKREYELTGEGFYNNRKIIFDALKSNEVFVLKYREKSIGLVIWSGEEILVNIDIFVIDNNYRQLGYGRIFFDAITNYLYDNDYKVIKLFCEPKSSEIFWKRLGFEKMHNCGYFEHELTYYKTIVRTASTVYIKGLDVVELWDVEPYMAEGLHSKWKWYVDVRNGKLTYPIISPCNYDWKLSWSRNGTVVKEDKVKYFTDEDFELYTDSMLYIKLLF